MQPKRFSSSSTPLRLPGFTLTELLVVLGIVAVLAAILFPVIASSRRKAQDATCVQNLRQISQALIMYVGDYDGAYPMGVEGVVINQTVDEHARLWGDLLLPYIHASTIPVCPTRDTSVLEESEKQRSSYCGYVINNHLIRRNGTKQQSTQQGRQETVLTYPSLTVVLLDARLGMIEAHKPDMAKTAEELDQTFGRHLEPDHAAFYLEQPLGGTRHHGGAHYAFADGHVKWLLPTALAVGRKSDGVNPGFGL